MEPQGLDKLDYWKVCTDFTVVQAALIACGVPPEDLQWEVERMDDSRCPSGYVAIRTGLKHALESGRLKPSKLVLGLTDDGEESRHIDVHSTTLSADEIDRYLKSRGMICAFFERQGADDQGIATIEGHLPVKLNAALKAWQAVTADPARLRGKSPKQALEHWLIEHAEELGLLNRKGTVNRSGIEEISKVANWKPAGGATPTPTTALPPRVAQAARQMVRLPAPREDFGADIDDDIPF